MEVKPLRLYTVSQCRYCGSQSSVTSNQIHSLTRQCDACIRLEEERQRLLVCYGKNRDYAKYFSAHSMTFDIDLKYQKQSLLGYSVPLNWVNPFKPPAMYTLVKRTPVFGEFVYLDADPVKTPYLVVPSPIGTPSIVMNKETVIVYQEDVHVLVPIAVDRRNYDTLIEKISSDLEANVSGYNKYGEHTEYTLTLEDAINVVKRALGKEVKE